MKNDVFSAVTMAVFLFVAGLTSAFWASWVFTVLWAWFVIPVFGLPTISVLAAYGLFLVIRLGTMDLAQKIANIEVQMKPLLPETDPSLVVRRGYISLGVGYLAPLMLLGIGWVIHAFM